MNKLKGLLYTLVVTLLFAACEPVESSYTVDGNVPGIYTVKNGSVLAQELTDSLLTVSNIGDFDLQVGDRVYLALYYFYDLYNPKNNELKIVDVIEKIPTLSVTERDSVNAAGYDLPLRPYGYYFQPSMWVWDNRLNVNALFAAKPEDVDFVMSLRNVRNDTVNFNLLAKTTAPMDTACTKLLSYDLNNFGTLLTEEEKVGLKNHKKLNFCVFMKNKTAKDSLIEQRWDVATGEFANPLY